MPPITIEDYEPDGNGGWFVEWHDAVNADGQPLTAHIHITPKLAAEFALLRAVANAPNDIAQQSLERAIENLERDRGTTPTIPPNVTPFTIRDFMEFYEQHVEDCCDRIKLNVAGHAPYEVLESARRGRPVDERYIRDKNKPVTEYAQRRMNPDQP